MAISIHAAREGGDINPRMPNAKAYISIHAAREGGDQDWNANINGVIISIHAAREGGDIITFRPFRRNAGISIHAAREGGDCSGLSPPEVSFNFNPRRP